MNTERLACLCICLCFLAVSTARCDKKSKRDRQARQHQPPEYHMHPSNQLPHDKQITTFLNDGTSKQYYYWCPSKSSIFVTLVSCSSPVDWTASFKKRNDSNTEQLLAQFHTNEMENFHWTAEKGLFVLNITTVSGSTQVNIYLSTEPGGPQALKFKQQTLKLVRKQRRKRLIIRWNPSLVDPQGTDYCVVVSISKHYTSLCSAQIHRHGQLTSSTNQLALAPRSISAWSDKTSKFGTAQTDPVIACVGSRTHYTTGELQQGQGYNFDLFAINRQSNLTYHHGSAFTVFNKRVKPTALKDGRTSFVSLKKLDGRAVFRYKVARKPKNSSLELYVMPCGGAVDVEVTMKGEMVTSKRNVESLGRIIITDPQEQARYYVRILSTNREELRKTSGVEVYATTKPSSRTSLPNMPLGPNVYEYSSLRTCDSVTVGWIPSPGQKVAYYCLVIREGKMKEIEGLRPPNQCGLENRLKKSADFFSQYCFYVKQDKEVLLRKISHLRPGRSYTVQVTVKKPKGKTLSYDLIQVQTLPICEVI